MNLTPLKKMEFTCEGRRYETWFFDNIEPGDIIEYNAMKYEISGYNTEPPNCSITLVKLKFWQKVYRFFFKLPPSLFR